MPGTSAAIRDRVREFRRVPAGEIRDNPKNWRTHPPEQREALRGLLAEIGFADAVLVRESADGALELINGHLRRSELPPDYEVPALILDLTEEEADKLLATFDPLGGMAQADAAALGRLVASLETENDAVAALLSRLAQESDLPALIDPDETPPPPAESLPESHVRMVQLFLNVETLEEFTTNSAALMAEWGMGNHTDVVMEALRRAANPPERRASRRRSGRARG